MRIEDLGASFEQIEAYFGFTEDQDVPELLEECARCGHPFDMMDTSFFVSRETLIPSVSAGMALWRERLFVSMSKNATKASEYFNVPDQPRRRARYAGRTLAARAGSEPRKAETPALGRRFRVRLTTRASGSADLPAHRLERLALDLPDPLGGNAVLIGEVLQRRLVFLAQPARLDDAAAAVVERDSA